MKSVSSAKFRISAKIILLQKLLSHTSVTQSGKVKDILIFIPDFVTDVTLKISAEIILLQKLLSHYHTSVTHCTRSYFDE